MELFRQSALQKMLSPEQLNQLIRITRPRDWLALAAVFIILLAIIIWSIWGEIPTEIPGDGIIVRQGGLRTVFATQTGVLTGFNTLKIGDVVQQGQTLAYLEQPLLVQQIQDTQHYLTQLLSLQTKKAAPTLQLTIAETRYHLNQLQSQWNLTSRIVSPYTGMLVELKTNEDSYVTPGTPLISLEKKEKVLQTFVFLPPTVDIDKVKPGMLVKIFPGVEKRAQLGYLIGKVQAVPKFPATQSGLMAVLHNMQLAQLFSRQGPPYIVYVNMVPDPHSVSGYQWSSAAGSATNIQSGTLSSVFIVLAKQAPIDLVIPSLK